MHDKTIEQVFKELQATEKGLSQTEVDDRLEKYGPNEIKEAKKVSPIKIFIDQFKSVVIWILIIATLISASLGEHVDAIVILIIIIFIAVLGFINEYRAERAIDALKKMASLKATVLRDGQKRISTQRNLYQGI